ncbi:hypothetical protein Cgig2_013803 [Carnegiea gigantea]|uniref:Uncharacterized protein n=1 Tax=Carnegiea gigantea TaxID=171969 RepID=A0A9Q1K398_9CARY|nr:hypothetical protein Cgig2_013803 [Carnegiea gigantea]
MGAVISEPTLPASLASFSFKSRPSARRAGREKDANIIGDDAEFEPLVNLLSNPKERHQLVRHDVKQVICAVCDTEQPVAKFCSKCGVSMGDYFREVCKFYDDEVDKRQFHCDECGICSSPSGASVALMPPFGHLDVFTFPWSCYSMGLRDNHLCVENAMKNCCPICYEYLFDSIKGTTVMRSGHTIHMECYREMLDQKQ